MLCVPHYQHLSEREVLRAGHVASSLVLGIAAPEKRGAQAEAERHDP